jgi:hypothetical protein
MFEIDAELTCKTAYRWAGVRQFAGQFARVGSDRWRAFILGKNGFAGIGVDALMAAPIAVRAVTA